MSSYIEGNLDLQRYEIDLKVLTGGHRGKAVPATRPKVDRFISGPVDVGWLSQARQLGVSALWVGLGLWHLRGLKRSDTFIVSNQFAEVWGVLPDAKARALRKLESAGLIVVEQRGKRSPSVTLVVKRLTEGRLTGPQSA